MKLSKFILLSFLAGSLLVVSLPGQTDDSSFETASVEESSISDSIEEAPSAMNTQVQESESLIEEDDDSLIGE